MKLQSFSQSARMEVQQQAFHHIFYTENFSEHLKNVENFEREQEVFLLHLIDLYYYLFGIADDNLYYPMVYKNVEQFIEYYWQEKQVLPIEDFNILYCIQERNRNEFCKNYPCFSIWEIKMSFESLLRRKLMTHLVGHKKATKEVLNFFPSSFEFTRDIMTSRDRAMETLTYNEQFLAYCNYLLNSGSSLILENDYYSMIQDLLYANINLCRNEPFELTSRFASENSRVLKRMESVRKISTSYYW